MLGKLQPLVTWGPDGVPGEPPPGDPLAAPPVPSPAELKVAELEKSISGYKGRATQAENELSKAKETYAAEKARLEAQASAEKVQLESQLRAANAAAAAALKTAEELQPKAARSSSLEAELAQTVKKVAKQDALMKFPSLLNSPVPQLIYSSTLEGETLDAYLKSLADAMGSKAPPAVGTGTPPTPPPAPESKAADFLKRAEEARSAGDMAKYDENYRQYLRSLDGEKGAFVPRIVGRGTGGDLPPDE